MDKLGIITTQDLERETALELILMLVEKYNGIETLTYESIVKALKEMNENGLLSGIISDAMMKEVESINSIGVNVKLYFDIKGDGTDESDQLQDAFDKAYQKGIKKLFFPDGIYNVSNIQTHGIKVVGNGCDVPFLGWEYTRPNGEDKYEMYLSRCKGTVFTTRLNLPIFKGELFIDNCGFFGDLRGSDTKALYPDTLMVLNEVVIKAFKKGIDMKDGCINPEINHCCIEQCVEGLVIDNQNNNNYTGEMNRLLCYRTSFCRCERHGIAGRIMGRTVHLDECTFEAIGEPSDPARPKATQYKDQYHAIDIELLNTNMGMVNGTVNIENCYAEETFGFIKIRCANPVGGIRIINNYWRPYDQGHYSDFLAIEGYCTMVEIKGNNIYTVFDEFVVNNFNCRNLSSDIYIKHPSTAIQTVASGENEAGAYAKVTSSVARTIVGFGAGFVTGMTFDAESYANTEEGKDVGVTYIFYDPSKLNGYDLGANEMLPYYLFYGKILRIGGNYFGCLVGKGHNLLIVRGNKTGISIGDGHCEILDGGGLALVDGSGTCVNLSIDTDGKILKGVNR